MARAGPIKEGHSPVMQRLAAVLLALVALRGCGSPMPNGDRVVDGLWIKEETPCPDPSSGACGAPVGDTARLALLAADPNAVITGASTAVPDCAQFSSGRGVVLDDDPALPPDQREASV